MSNRHPQLKKEMLAEGVSYACAYLRLDNGWDLERACTQTPKPRNPRLKREIARVQREQRPKWKRKGWRAEDTSPPHIQAIRTEYCAKFVKGVVDTKLLAKLREYADECRTATENLARVSTGETAQPPRGWGTGTVDDGAGNPAQTGVAVAARIYDYLRS